jgi:TPP-dependent pyruvate/acetoin dehydrogenase alpha subunit
LAHGIPGYYIDGNDVLAVYEFMKNAVRPRPVTERARSSSKLKPTVILVTQKATGIFTAQRKKSTNGRGRDPIGRFQTLLLEANLITETDIEKIHEEMARLIDEAVEFAENSPEPDASECHGVGLCLKLLIVKQSMMLWWRRCGGINASF